MYLQHLEYLLAVAEDLHFRKAAERLLISQSSLSYHVKQLEAEVGAALLRRDRKTVALTPAGAVFIEHSRLALAEADLAVREARRIANVGSDNLTVGANESLFGIIVPRLIRQCDLQHPTMRLAWESCSPAAAFHALQNNRIDAAITTTVGLDQSEYLASETMFAASLRIAVPSGHGLARLSRISLGAIADEPLLCLSDAVGGLTESYVKRFARSFGIDIKANQRVDGIQPLLALVAAGKGVSILPSVARHVHCEGVRYKRLEQSRESISYQVVWKIGRQSATLSHFRRAVGALFVRNRGLPKQHPL